MLTGSQDVSKFIRAASQASPSEECLNFVDNSVDDMLKKIMEFRGQAKDIDGDNSDHLTFVSSDAIQPKGLII